MEDPDAPLDLVLMHAPCSYRKIAFDALMASARASIELLGRRSEDRWLLCMPLFHVGGLSIVLRSVLAGATVSFDEVDVVAGPACHEPEEYCRPTE